ncbi:perforin-1-like [Eucyclogobius newberryi]|uniref:perforin-1-like n=1 Tax=Eucyclogobius newberryi TaxID=166745 RepID=UPI003B5CC640
MHLLLLSVHLLLLTHDSQQYCSDGKPKDCLEAEFAPGTTLGGEGFDITKMEPKGAYVIDMNQWKRKDKSCTLCSNPFLENKKQKLPLSVVDWRPKQSCSAKVSSQLHKSSESVVSSTTASIQNNWKVNLDVNVAARSGNLMLAGTNSKMAEYSMEKTKNDKYSFSSQSMSCEFYRYRLSNTPKLHREFKRAVNKLPKAYNAKSKQQFYGLIQKFGTHYITKVQVGGSVMSVTSIRECEASLQGLSVEEVQACLEVEAAASFGSAASAKTEAKHCKSDIQKSDRKSSFASSFNDRFTEIKGGHNTEPDLLFSASKDPSAYKDWLSTLPQHPDIISYALDPLHELLPAQAPARSNLRSAISHYILETGLWRNCSAPCPNGVKTDPRDPCVCQCHNNAAVNTDCCPTERGLARVVITVQRADGLWGDHTTATDGYVKVYRGKSVWRSGVIYNNNNPHFRYVIDWGTVNLAENKVRFEVWDEDNKYDDDLLGECERFLTAGVKDDVCNLQHGRLFFRWHVQCAPNLGGSLCKDYKASPMNPSLKARFRSRHAHPVPEALLQEWGVVRDKSTQTVEE